MSSTCAVTYYVYSIYCPYSLLYESERVSTIGNKCENIYIYMYNTCVCIHMYMYDSCISVCVTGSTHEVRASYTAREKDELTVASGDAVTVLSAPDDGWWVVW